MRNFIYKICLAATISIIIGMYAINLMRIENNTSLEILYIIGYGGLFSFDFDSNIFGFLRVLVPQFLLVFLLAEYMYSDFKICSVYVFTRANRRHSWFLKKFFSLLIITLVYYVVQFVILLVMGVLSGFSPERFDVFVRVVISSLVLHVLIAFILVCVANLLSLKVGINFGYMCVIIFNTVMIMTPSVTYGLFDNSIIIKILPGSNGMLLGHSDNFVKVISDKFGFDTLEGFSVSFSIIYLITIIIVLFYIGSKLIEYLDIINDNKEV